jgi:putative tricarboxylic transport membrane protein
MPMADTPDSAGDVAPRGFIRSPLDVGGGLFLLAIAAIGYAEAAGFFGRSALPFGHMNSIGSGLLPKSVAILVGVFGLGLALQSLFVQGDRLEAWGIRGPVFVLGAVIVFALTIRTMGLAVAGPLCVIVAAMADRDTRPVELVIFAIVMTAVCIGMFKFILRLPIPIFPPGYGPF